MGRDRLGTAGHDQRQALGVIAARLDSKRLGLDGAGGRALGATAHSGVQLGQRQVALVVGAAEPLGRDAADPLATGDVDLVGTGHGRGGAGRIGAVGRQGLKHGRSPDGSAGSLSLDPQPVTATAAALSLSSRCRAGTARCARAPVRGALRVHPQKGSAETRLGRRGRLSPPRLGLLDSEAVRFTTAGKPGSSLSAADE